jgi:predicted MFS family arabinose efflux permease
VLVVVGLRALNETRDPKASGLPDPIGTVLIAAIPALLSFAIIEGPDRGWGNTWVIGAFILAALLVPTFILRTARATRPVLDLALFAVRQVRLTNAATLLFATAFYGMLLGNVVFLQTEWHYSVLRAALAAAPSPLVVTAVARTSSRIAGRIGPRPVLLAGAVIWAIGSAGLALAVGATPHWLTAWLPWSLLIGLGIGLTLPVQSGASVQSLPAAQYGVGSAVNSSFRQLGAVLGISIFVAVLGNQGGVSGFHHTWWVFAALGLASGLIMYLPRLRRASAGNTAGKWDSAT